MAFSTSPLRKLSPVEATIECFDTSYDPYDFCASQKIEVSSSRNSLQATHYTQKPIKPNSIKFTLQDLIDLGNDSKKVLKYMSPERFIQPPKIASPSVKHKRSQSQNKAGDFAKEIALLHRRNIEALLKSQPSIADLETKIMEKKRGVDEKNNMLYKLSSRELVAYMKTRKAELAKHLQIIKSIKKKTDTIKNERIVNNCPDNYNYTCEEDEDGLKYEDQNKLKYESALPNPMSNARAHYWGKPKSESNLPSPYKTAFINTMYKAEAKRPRHSTNFGITSINHITELQYMKHSRKCFDNVLDKFELTKNSIKRQMKTHKTIVTERHKSNDEVLGECKRMVESNVNFNKVYKDTERKVSNHLRPYKNPLPGIKEILLHRKVVTMKHTKNKNSLELADKKEVSLDNSNDSLS